MTQVVLNISETDFGGISQVFSGSYAKPRTSAPTREIIILGIILTLLQVCDGVLTGIGISAFGTAAEGNGFLRFLMEQIGFVPALMMVKSAAIAVTAVLCWLSMSVGWIRHALKAVIGVYVLAAVLPWTLILVNQVL